MYRCNICEAVSPPGRPRLVHVVPRIVDARDGAGRDRSRVETAAELPVCPRCHGLLASGRSVAAVARLTAKEREARRAERKRPDPEPCPQAAEPEPRPAARAVLPTGPVVVGRPVGRREPPKQNQ